MLRFGKVLLATGLLLSAANVSAQSEYDSEIIWNKPETYSDIKAVVAREDKFRMRLFKTLNKEFKQSVEDYFPRGYNMKLVMNDLDLSGVVVGDSFFGQSRLVRMVGEGHKASMRFDFVIYNQLNMPILRGSDGIVDTNTKYKKRHSVPFHVEKKLIKNWVRSISLKI